MSPLTASIKSPCACLGAASRKLSSMPVGFPHRLNTVQFSVCRKTFLSQLQGFTHGFNKVPLRVPGRSSQEVELDVCGVALEPLLCHPQGLPAPYHRRTTTAPGNTFCMPALLQPAQLVDRNNPFSCLEPLLPTRRVFPAPYHHRATTAPGNTFFMPALPRSAQKQPLQTDCLVPGRMSQGNEQWVPLHSGHTCGAL